MLLSLRNNFRKLEESLWRTETRFDRAYMERILAPDFFEFGRSGHRYTRKDILSHPKEELKAQLKNITVHEILKDIVLVTYISEVMYDTLEVGNRSSLWIKTPAGWQLKFHQGTPLKYPVVSGLPVVKFDMLVSQS